MGPSLLGQRLGESTSASPGGTVPEVSTTGERSLFFTHRRREERWRLTEKVAAVLEGNFTGRLESLFTFSTATIPNGTPYAIPLDVAYSVLPDPLAAFAFVQVKDHSTDKVEREYIDAVIGQRVQTGIQHCVVVSTTGFTRDAKELARVQDVKLRILQREAKWPYPGYLPLALEIRFDPQLELRAAVLVVLGSKGIGNLQLEGDDLLRPILDIEGTNCSLNDIFNRSLAEEKRREEVISPIRADPSIDIVNVGQTFVGSRVFVRTVSGTFSVEGVAYHARVLRFDTLRSPVIRQYVYRDPLAERDLAWCAMADFRLSKVDNHKLGNVLYHFCLWRFPNGANDSVGGAFFPE
jgi:hypothetical protein